MKPNIFLSLSLLLFIFGSVQAAPGALDRGFGNNGIVITPLPNRSDIRESIFQPDGKLIIVGVGFQQGTNQDFFAQRFDRRI